MERKDFATLVIQKHELRKIKEECTATGDTVGAREARIALQQVEKEAYFLVSELWRQNKEKAEAKEENVELSALLEEKPGA